MALANKATNVTLYDAGGSGDNIIADGFIKTVEKVWIDTITISSSLTAGVGAIFDIAKVPAGKKITGIEVYGVGAGNLDAGTTANISIGARYGTGSVTNATQFLAARTFGSTTLDPFFANTNIGIECTSSTHTIFVQFTGASASITSSTITTKVKYT